MYYFDCSSSQYVVSQCSCSSVHHVSKGLNLRNQFIVTQVTHFKNAKLDFCCIKRILRKNNLLAGSTQFIFSLIGCYSFASGLWSVCQVACHNHKKRTMCFLRCDVECEPVKCRNNAFLIGGIIMLPLALCSLFDVWICR